MPSPHAIPITLSEAARAALEGWASRRKTAQDLARRARIVLACAEGATNRAVAQVLRASRPTVALWRRRFAEHGPDGLLDAPRPGAPRKITDARVERAVTTTLEATPTHATHWSTRTMAHRAGMSQAAVSRVWRAFGLRPHRTETFKLSKDPLSVGKVRHSAGLYLAPPERALVLRVDEKPQIQAARGTAPAVPMRPGQAERRTHDYRRHGTLDLFAALDAKAGTAIGACRRRRRRRRAREFRAFLGLIEASVPPDLGVHLVLGNLKAHGTKLIRDWLAKRPRFHPHFTPTGAPWLDLAEAWFALLSRRRLERGASTGVGDLEEAILAHIDETNAEPKPFVWTKAADDILDSVRRFCQRTATAQNCQENSNS